MAQEQPILFKEMSQLYARVFVKILDSSIAEDYTLRHIFEDFLKLADHKTGIVDITRQVLSRRLNIPLEVLNPHIERLESPDPNSRDPEFDGRRLERLDEHRDWGWRIVNWSKYESIRTKADVSNRQSKHREKEKLENPPKGFQKPSIEQVKLYCSENSIPMADAEWFFFKCEGNEWTNAGRPIKNWEMTLQSWKRANYLPTQKNPNGTLKPVEKQPQPRKSGQLRWGNNPDGTPRFYTKDNPPQRKDFGESDWKTVEALYQAEMNKIQK